jgi:hypothetical protein
VRRLSHQLSTAFLLDRLCPETPSRLRAHCISRISWVCWSVDYRAALIGSALAPVKAAVSAYRK